MSKPGHIEVDKDTPPYERREHFSSVEIGELKIYRSIKKCFNIILLIIIVLIVHDCCFRHGLKSFTSFNAHNNPVKHVHYYLHFSVEGNGLRDNDLNIINGSNTGRI